MRFISNRSPSQPFLGLKTAAKETILNWAATFPFRFAVVLAFDVRIEREAQELADSLGVKLFSADIIYHLFDKFTAWREVWRTFS